MSPGGAGSSGGSGGSSGLDPQGVRLSPGANTSLTDQVPELRRVVIGLGWVLDTTGGAPVELDAQVLLVGPDGRADGEDAVVFFSQLDPGSPPHPGGGAPTPGRDDVEQVVVDLAAVPASVSRIVVSAAIYDAAQRHQTYQRVRRAFVRIADADAGHGLARHDLADVTGQETAVVFGELYRHRAGWKFRAVGQGYSGGLAAVLRDYGLSL